LPSLRFYLMATSRSQQLHYLFARDRAGGAKVLAF
jgi:hypothetical protein